MWRAMAWSVAGLHSSRTTKKRSKRDMMGGEMATFALSVLERSYLRILLGCVCMCGCVWTGGVQVWCFCVCVCGGGGEGNKWCAGIEASPHLHRHLSIHTWTRHPRMPPYRPKMGLAAARMEVRALSVAWMPALVMEMVCCSIASWMAT